jgi:hypothetical protein
MKYATKRQLVRLALLATSAASVAIAFDFTSRFRESVEHGNSLYHEGQVEGASDIYRARLDAEVGEGEASYNLGTALMSLGSPEAEEYLRFATELPDSTAIQRAFYNLGHLFLTRAAAAEGPEYAIPQLAGAVATGRAALRLRPDDQDARWNLAMAQILLDSLMPDPPPAVVEEEEETRSDGGMVIPEIARLGIPRGREFEAPAGEDPGSLNPAEARALIDGVETDVEAMIRGILWSRRPKVDPWLEPYPGGSR